VCHGVGYVSVVNEHIKCIFLACESTIMHAAEGKGLMVAGSCLIITTLPSPSPPLLQC
jgi:hypothetical protein